MEAGEGGKGMQTDDSISDAAHTLQTGKQIGKGWALTIE
jgi:hypothetical protein